MASVGMVLSGGMAKGAYQLGALRAIGEWFAPSEFSQISCASVGSLNGYAFTMQRLAQAEAMWHGLCETETRMFVGKVLRSNFLQQSVGLICNSNDVLPTCLRTTLLNFGKRRVSYTNLQEVPNDRLASYLRASVAMPIYNHSVKIGQHSYFDGAMVDNIPVFPLLAEPPDYIFCIYFDDTTYMFENEFFDSRIIKITLPARNRLKDSVLFRKDSIADMLEQGYEKTAELLHVVFAGGKDDLEGIYRCIALRNREATAPKLRVTGDVFVSNLNRIAQKFSARKIE